MGECCCSAVAPEGGWLCVLVKQHAGEHLSLDNTAMWKGTPGRPVRWPGDDPPPKRAAPTGRLQMAPDPMGLGPPQDGQQYTGNECSNCHGMRLVRQGACDTCLDCGTTTGCG